MKKRANSKKRVISILLVISMILGIAANKISQQSKIKNVSDMLQSNDFKQLFIDEWYKALSESNFSRRVKK